MDMKFIVLFLLGGMSGFQAVDAAPSCIEDLTALEFNVCLMEYVTFLDRVVADADASHYLRMTAICSEQGEAKRACLKTFIQQCPELDTPIEKNTKNGKIAATYSVMTGVGAMCSQLAGDKCGALMTCLNESTGEESFKTLDRGYYGSALGSLPMKIGMLCGPIKRQLACLVDAPADCSDLAKSIKEQITMMVSKEMAMLSDPFEDSKQFIKEQCPKVADGFPTDKCVKRTLNSRNFQECSAEVYMAFVKEGFNESCKPYTMGTKCIDKHIGESCGQASANTLITVAPFFIDAIPEKCYQRTPGSEGIQATMSTFIMLMLFTIGRLVLELN